MRYAASFKLPECRDRPLRVDWLWVLHKNKQTATCELWTHPAGGEVRLAAGHFVVRSEAGRNALALMEQGIEWRQPLIEQGWTPDESFTIPPYDGEPRRFRVLYTIRHPNTQTATCEVWTHEFGGQVRLEVTLPLTSRAHVKSKVLRMRESTDPGVLLAHAEEWRQEYANCGWTE
jgi:hypothetical protein